MELRTYRHAWGAVGPGAAFSSFSELVPAARAAGYQGIELAPVVFDVMPRAYGTDGAERLRELLAEHELELLPMVMTFGTSVREHLTQFEHQLEQVMDWGPSFVVSHTGSDAFDDVQSAQLLAACDAVAQQLGVQVAHETHRGRILCTPWRTAAALDRVPGLWLKADFSHFVCSSERLLADEPDLMTGLCSRVLHADHRVGFENGPQVPDPRDTRWSDHLTVFQGWWDEIWRAAEARGDSWTSVTPEYGPPSYAPHDLDAGALWDLCEWAAASSRERFSSGVWRSVLAAEL